MKIKKKSEVSINTFFYIFMLIIFVGILIFGFNKMFMLEESLTEQEILEVSQYIKSSFDFCDDPMNAGTRKIIEIETNGFNGIYIIGSDINKDNYNGGFYDELKMIKEGGDNVVLFNAEFYIQGDEVVFENFNIVKSFNIDVPFNQVGYFLDGDTTFNHNGKKRDDSQDGFIDFDLTC